jgi:folate-binding protein YgfZ
MSNLSSPTAPTLADAINNSNNDCTLEQAQAGYICHLSDLGHMVFSGDDAAQFLHGQLTNEMVKFPNNQARLAAYCTPKGRILSSFLSWRQGSDIVLQCSKDLQTGIQKRLQMFIMRSKVKVLDASAAFVTLGLGGQQAISVLAHYFPQIAELESIFSSQENQFGRLIRVHDGFGLPRYQWLLPVELTHTVSIESLGSLTWCDQTSYKRAEILAGIAQITGPTQEKFVPQMINFEVVGAVNFRKGCYPGQEIVARSQYLGKLKRRMAIAKIANSEVSAGTEIFSKEDPSQPCGMVVNAEIDFDGVHSLCLLEIKIADQHEGHVYLSEQTNVFFEFLALPYALIDVTE